MTGVAAAAAQARLEAVVFALVVAAFANIYLTQPLLPVLEQAFAADTVRVARTVSAVLFGIALANLPWGWLADRFRVGPLIAAGAVLVAGAGLVCATTSSLGVLTAARFLQGAAMPALTTCLAAHLARSLPPARLNVVMGSYVAATVLGGMLGRLLGGFLLPAASWRLAFVVAAVVLLLAAVMALMALPGAPPPAAAGAAGAPRYRDLLGRGTVWLPCLCGAAGQAVFSPVFNYIPYRLATAPFHWDARAISAVYLVYLVGIFMGPGAGRLANRHGTGATLLGGAAVLALALLLLLVPAPAAVVLGLAGVCLGFFSVHAAAVGALNRRLEGGQGRANALYVLCYYLGAWFGITWAGYAWLHGGWQLVMGGALLLTLLPTWVGLRERRMG